MKSKSVSGLLAVPAPIAAAIALQAFLAAPALAAVGGVPLTEAEARQYCRLDPELLSRDAGALRAIRRDPRFGDILAYAFENCLPVAELLIDGATASIAAPKEDDRDHTPNSGGGSGGGGDNGGGGHDGEDHDGPGKNEGGPGKNEGGPGKNEGGPGKNEGGPGKNEGGPGKNEGGPGKNDRDDGGSGDEGGADA